MAIRSLLLVYEPGSVQQIVKSYILSEIQEIHIEEAYSYSEAIEKLQEKPYSVILCSGLISQKEAGEVYHAMQKLKKHLVEVFATLVLCHFLRRTCVS